MQYYPERPYRPELSNTQSSQQPSYYTQDYTRPTHRASFPQNEQMSYPHQEDVYESGNGNRHYNQQYQDQQSGANYPNNVQQWSENSHQLNQRYSSEPFRNKPFHSDNPSLNPRLDQPHFNENQYEHAQHRYDNCQRPNEQPMENIQRRLDHVQVGNFQQQQYNDPPRHRHSHENEPDIRYQEPQPNQSYDRNYIDSSNRNRHLDLKPTYAHNNSNEPMHLHQIGKPQVLAKTSGDGDAVAVFGVVAQVEKSPTYPHSPTFQQTPPSAPNQPPQDVSSPPYDGSNRNHNLTPIMEQPNSPPSSYNHRDPNYSSQHDYGRGAFDNRNSMPISKPDVNDYSRRSHYSGEFERSRDLYRDEYTDSSGYGSTLTERSYEGPSKSQAPYKPDNRPSDRFSSQPQQHYQQQSYRQETQENYPRNPSSIQQQNQKFARQDNFNDIQHRMDRNPPRPIENMQENRSHDRYPPQNQDYSIDASQTKSVQSVKRMFNKPGAAPLPPVSASYGSNQYNNSRPLPPRPHIPSDGNRFQQEPSPHSNQDYHQQPPQQMRNEQSYQSYDNAPRQPQYSTAQPSGSHQQQNTGRVVEPPHHYQQSRQSYPGPRSPPVRSNMQFDENKMSQKSSLPHYDPPPQHSQSMSNIDELRPREVWNKPPAETKSRNSYANTQDSDMVVGVRFDKRDSSRLRRSENQVTNAAESYAPNYKSDSTNNADNATTKVQVRKFQPNQSSPERSVPPHNQPNYNHQETSYERERTSAPAQPDPSYLPQQARSPPYSYKDSNLNVAPVRGPSRSPQPSQFEQQQPFPRREQRQEDSRSQSQAYESSRDRRSYTIDKEQGPNQLGDNYVPDVVTRSYGLYSQSSASDLRPQASEEWPEPPTDAPGPPYQSKIHKTEEVHVRVKQSEITQVKQPRSYPDPHPSNSSRIENRQSPAGGDSKQTLRQIPRHPFDPDDDDSSEEVDVDAPTPPPSTQQSNRYQQRSNASYSSNEQNWIRHPGSLPAQDEQSQQRPVPAGERHHQSRQPGDGLNEDQYPTSQPGYRQANNNARPIAPKKPFRNSLKQRNNSKTNQQAQLPPEDPSEDAAPLNHDHPKEKARLVQSGKVVKKLPNRAHNSSTLAEVPEDNSNSDYEINVTSNDLAHSQTSQPITVHQPATESKPKDPKQRKPAATNQHPESLNEGTQTEPLTTSSNQASKLISQKKTKLIFKRPPDNALKNDPRVTLPNIKEPAGQDKKMPPTYTDLLSQFTSHRVTALRTAVQKHDKALKTVQAAMHVDDQSDASRLSKRDENRQIYNQSKPKYTSSRDEPSKDRNRSSGRSKTRSPDRHGLSHSRDRLISPERRDRDFDREHRSRKSEKEKRHHRPVSPHRGRDEDPYHHAPHHRRDEPPSHSHHREGEPEWVEQFRKKRAGNEPPRRRKDRVDDPKRCQRKEFDFDQYQRDVKNATSYNSDFEQPTRKQLFPAKLMAKGHAKPNQRPPPGNADWMKNLKEHNRVANKNRR